MPKYIFKICPYLYLLGLSVKLRNFVETEKRETLLEHRPTIGSSVLP